jgi:hypothetical protein
MCNRGKGFVISRQQAPQHQPGLFRFEEKGSSLDRRRGHLAILERRAGRESRSCVNTQFIFRKSNKQRKDATGHASRGLEF